MHRVASSQTSESHLPWDLTSLTAQDEKVAHPHTALGVRPKPVAQECTRDVIESKLAKVALDPTRACSLPL